MRRGLLAGLGLMIAAPVLAQSPPAPAQPAAALLPPPDPARLAMARRIVDKVVPPGTMRRMMETSLGAMTGSLLASFVPAARQAELRQKDPAFDERMRRIMTIMAGEVGTLMAEMEPQMRDAAAVAYARRFDLHQLADIAAFFDTPSGTAYAAQSLTLGTDPDVMRVSLGLVPRLLQRMPDISAKIKAATADLPPAPAPAPATKP